MTLDSNGWPVHTDVAQEYREGKTVWGRTVWIGANYVTSVRRYYYTTRGGARDGDISDDIGMHGRVA